MDESYAVDAIIAVLESPLTADQRWEASQMEDAWWCRSCSYLWDAFDEDAPGYKRGEFPDEMLCPDCHGDAEPARSLI